MQYASSADIHMGIVRWIRDSFHQKLQHMPLDVRSLVVVGDAGKGYALIDPGDAARLIDGERTTDRRLYRRGVYDCEDFAYAARVAVAYKMICRDSAQVDEPPDVPPPAFGVFFCRNHALNIGVGRNGVPYLLDVVHGKLHTAENTLANALNGIVNGWLKGPEEIHHVVI